MSDMVIAINAPSKSFGKHLILEKVSLTVRQGERYGLVGLNGAVFLVPAKRAFESERITKPVVFLNYCSGSGRLVATTLAK
jgi:hypothetical protein